MQTRISPTTIFMILLAVAGLFGIEQVAYAESDHLLKGDYADLDLSSEQLTQLQSLQQTLASFIRYRQQQIDALAASITAELLNRLPDEGKIATTQREILKLRNEVSIERVKTNVKARKLLTVEQRLDLIFGDPKKTIRGVTLTAEQLKRFRQLKNDYLSTAIDNTTKQANLLLDMQIILKDPLPNESTLFAKQAELSKLKDSLDLASFALEINIRKLLTPEQRETAYSRHHPKIWLDTGIDSKQNEELGKIHCMLEQGDEKGRRALIPMSTQILRLYNTKPLPDEETLVAAELAYDQTLADVELEQLKQIIGARHVLTPTQLEKLYEFMRAHPVAD